MSDTDELLREVERQTDSDLETGRDREVSPNGREEAATREPTSESTERSRLGGFRSRLPSRPSAPTILTPRGLLLTLVLTVAGFLVGGAIPLIGGVTGLLGIGVAGFVLGFVGKGRYLELALAGAATGAVAFFLDRLVLSVAAGFAVPLTLVGGGAGLLAAVLGLYFGRDLRDGLTRGV